MRPLLAVLTVLLVLTAGAAGVAVASPDKMTICHKAAGEQPRTMQVARSAWQGHKGHGDQEGACPSAASGTPPAAPTPPPPPPPPRTTIAVRHEADGDPDGDARFRIVVHNDGGDDALGLRLGGPLAGEGRWSVHDGDGAPCRIQDGLLACAWDALAPDKTVTLSLAFDGRLEGCEHASIDLTLSADNDASQGDDRAARRVAVGACSVVDDEPL